MNESSVHTKQELKFNGLAASPGIAISRSCLCKLDKTEVQEERIDESQASRHYAYFRRARIAISRELNEIYEKEENQETAAILATQIEIIQDPDLHDRIVHLIYERLMNVDYAIFEAFRTFLEIVQNTQSPLFQERMSEIKDLRDRLIRHVQNKPHRIEIEPSSVVVTDEMSPGDLIRYSKHDLKGLALDTGGLTSHTSIIAHSMGIPAVVGISSISHNVETGDQLIVDGNQGVVYVNPTEETRQWYHQLLEQQKKNEERLNEIVKEKDLTTDGHPFSLRANVEFKEELHNVKKYRAQGVGLLRTESLYLARGSFDDYEAQINFYTEILKHIDGQPLTVRLFDAGGDKLMDQTVNEANPFLGWRGIRMLLKDRELLRNQLYAVIKSAADYPGQVRILVPMVSVLEEVITVNEELNKAKELVRGEGIELDSEIKLGIMVEVPSVALQIDSFAPYVDFFSIGTNDLTQYMLAVDRGNDRIAHLYQQHHPAVWRVIDFVVKSALKNKIEVAVCGEIAAHPMAAACLMGMGIYDLSMSPASIPKVKEMLINHSMKEMRQLSDAVKKTETQEEVETLFNTWNSK